jgi:predicted thioesterase
VPVPGDGPEIEAGAAARASFTVTDDDTAIAVGSGSLPVLGTPRLLAWCESVTCAALAAALPPTSTSVGARVELDHRAASPVGATVLVEAVLDRVDGTALHFSVAARHLDDSVVAAGTIMRVVVDSARFLDRLRPASQEEPG